MTSRCGGVSAPPFDTLNLGLGCGDRPEDVRTNRARVAAALGCPALVFARQVHGRRVATVTRTDEDPGEADALVTERPGLLLGVLGADCPGILLVAPRRGVLAVLHAGWRGVVAGVVPATLAHLERTYGVGAASLHGAIGPGVSRDRYEVGADVAAQVVASAGAAAPGAEAALTVPSRPGHLFVDLVAALRRQLERGGVPAQRIAVHGACTVMDARWFSHRRDGPRTGRHALVAGFR